MSSARNGGRLEGEGRGRLVLLQGGLAPGALVDADWQAFGARIGWQPGPAALPDDYEEALAARIFGGRAPDDNVVPIELARGHRRAHPTRVDAVAAGAESGRHRRPGRHLATVVLAVAAALVLVTAAALSLSARPSASTVPVPAPEVTERANVAPEVAPERPPEAERAVPVEAPPPRHARPEASAPRAPRETAPRERAPAPRDALVARGPARDPATNGAGAGARPAAELGAPPAAELAHADGATEPRADVAPDLLAPPERVGFASTYADTTPPMPLVPGASPEPVEPASWLEAAPRATAPAASFSLGDSGERWYGVALSAPREPTGAPAGIRAMAQLDLGKALGAL